MGLNEQIIAADAWDILRHSFIDYYIEADELVRLLRGEMMVVRTNSYYGGHDLYFCDGSRLSLIWEFSDLERGKLCRIVIQSI